MQLTPHIQRQIEKILRAQSVELAYLFGSSANHTDTPKSDVDIAVLFSDGFSKEERFGRRLALIGALSRFLKQEADVVVLNDLSSLFFRYVIVKEGVLLHQRSEAVRLDFESRTFGLYFDFQPFLIRYNQEYVKRGLQ